MVKKIFRSIVAVAMAVMAASLLITSGFLYEYYSKSQENQLKEELDFAAEMVEKEGVEFLESLNFSLCRFTLVSPDGSVLYDSMADLDEMDNHTDREEIAEALKTGRGSSKRYSATLTQRTVYEAVRLENGEVLRASVNQATVGTLILNLFPAITGIVLVSVALALFLSHKMSKSIVKPFNEIDLENPEKNETYDELAPMLEKISTQHRQILAQMLELKRRTDEFEKITGSMNEGLVLLDKNGNVLSMNTAAEKLFCVDDTVKGCSFLSVDRSVNVTRAVEKALQGKRSNLTETRNGREYRFIVSCNEYEGTTAGAVILCIDVTETAFAERNRREFTANVSHELKTPLQSIIGSAELLENGLVEPEDTNRFIGNIKNEAVRLVNMIEEIIRLSRLDEGSCPPAGRVNLYAVAADTVESLKILAEKKRVRIVLDGERDCFITGVKSYLQEIIYNLCDNAIRYNKEGGEVKVALKKDKEKIVLSVSDTGIGIPAEHRNRIFERFYRVDKSHSRETGGTGLGLSIVKHAVAYHGGTLTLDSEENKGTVITVCFHNAPEIQKQ